MKIEVVNLSKSFKDNMILNNINLKFESGNIYGLTGLNGSGKSVFLKLLCGFYEPTNGTILYDNVDIVKSRIFPPNTRSLIEKPSFLPNLTGFENLKLLANIQNKIDDNKIIETLKLVELESAIHKKYRNYSLGMKQKLGIAQVLMEDPQIIILDEPFNGIEETTAKKLRNVLINEKNKGKIILIATHIKDDIETLADKIYKFSDSNIFEISKEKWFLIVNLI